MTFGQGLGQREIDSGTDPDERVPGDSQLPGDVVGCMESDAPDIPCQSVGIGTDDIYRVIAVPLQDLRRTGGPYVMLMQKNHGIPDLFPGIPGRCDLFRPLPPDTLDFQQSFGTGFDDIEHLRAELADQTPCIGFSDALDQP